VLNRALSFDIRSLTIQQEAQLLDDRHLVYRGSMEAANLPIFFKYWNAKTSDIV